jgi:NADPH-dependent 2,4-dienoyl-CoA reductase/sulfur reductase-like enzyme
LASSQVIIVGAGPAGVRAAEALVTAGLRPIMIDEGTCDGGQIYRRQPTGFVRSYKTLYGTEANRARNLHQSFESLRESIDYRPETLAWGLWEKQLYVSSGNRGEAFDFSALIVAGGATDRLMPVPGWELAGVYSMGAAQIALKAQAVAIGRQVVLMGSGPLLYLVANQYLDAGANVAAVVDTAPTGSRFKALPLLFARPGLLAKGISLAARLRFNGVPVYRGATPLSIKGDASNGVGSVRFRSRTGSEREISCDAIALGWHLRPESQLADLARCDFHFDPVTHQWLPSIDTDGRSSISGVYLAGDGVRLLGAEGAEIAGRLAALAVLNDLGHAAPVDERVRLRRRLDVMDRFHRGLAVAFPWQPAAVRELADDAVICRCESITAGDIRETIRVKGAVEVNRTKALCRVGMGRCQGRYCSDAAAEIIAAETNSSVEQVGRLRGQAPIKPLAVLTEQAGTITNVSP